jgi:hypothetical protein
MMSRARRANAQRERKMSEMESLIGEIRERLNASKEEGSIDPLAAVTDLADRYSISEREIFALLEPAPEICTGR